MKAPKDTTKTNVHKCNPVGCNDPLAPEELKQFCKDKVGTKYFGPEYELYITNFYGNIEQRVTNNNVWEGEVTVDTKNNRIYYSKVAPGRVDIFYRRLGDLSNERVSCV